MEEKFPSMLAMEYLKLRQRVGELEVFEAEFKEANEARGRFISLLNELSEPVCICGPDGTVLYLNSRFEELVPASVDCAFYDSAPAYVRELLEKALRGERAQTELSIEGSGVFEFSCLPLKDGLGRLAGAAITGREVTCLRRAEEELASYRARLEAVQPVQGAPFGAASLSKILDGANDAIIVVDTSDSKIIYANSKAASLTGKSVHELIGMHQSALHPAEDADYYRSLFEEYSMKDGAITEEEIFIQHSFGSRIPVEISTSVIELDGRRALQGVFRDISGRADTDKDLKRLGALFDRNVCPIISADINGNIEYVNTAFEDAIGFRAEDVVGMQLKSIVSNMSLRENDKMRMALYEGRPWTGVVQNRKKDGTACLFNILITPIRSKNGHVTSFLSVHHYLAG